MKRRGFARQRGVSLIEFLAVMALVGVIAVVTFGEVSNTIRKWRLDGAVNEVSAFFDSMTRRAQENHQQVFLHLVGHQLMVSRNLDGTGVLATLTVPDYIAFHATNPTWVTVNWPVSTGGRILGCDPRGLTMNPVTGQMVGAEQTLVMTHVDMATGSLKPRIVYSVRISPLWRCYVVRTVL